MSDRREWNKQTALDFLDLMFKPDAIEEDAGDTYIQHNPEVAIASRRLSTTSSGWRRTAPGSGSSSSGRLPTVTM